MQSQSFCKLDSIEFPCQWIGRARTFFIAAPLRNRLKYTATLFSQVWRISAGFQGYGNFATDTELLVKIYRRGRRLPETKLQEIHWPSVGTLQRICQLNGKSLKAVVSSKKSGLSNSIEVFDRQRELWLAMDEASCERAAQMPILLLDFNFDWPEWWQWVVRGGPRPVGTAEPDSPLLPASAGPLLREILVDACLTARSHGSAAKLVFGMSEGVCKAFTELSASEIDSIALAHFGELQLRWSDNSIFWTNLLVAALEGSEGKLADAQLHCLQLL